MTWQSLIARRLRELADRLRLLAGRVREAAAEAVAEAVSRATGDALLGRPGGSYLTDRDYRGRDRYGYERDEYDNRDDEEEPDYGGDYRPRPVRPSLPLAGVALEAAGWWLRARGRWPGALALGLLLAGATLLGGPWAAAALAAAEAAATLCAWEAALAGGAAALDRR
jgi:hypothetical protein